MIHNAHSIPPDCGDKGENQILPRKRICFFSVEKENQNKAWGDFTRPRNKVIICASLPVSINHNVSYRQEKNATLNHRMS